MSTGLERVLVAGDLSRLTEPQRVEYYGAVCKSLGLNPLTRPFDYITLQGKVTLYAKRDATDQLRKNHAISIKIVSREWKDDVFSVVAQASEPGGRCDESIGAVNVGGLKGEAMANALMKAETKAKRRVTLSICGLGWMDELEAETVGGPVAEESAAAKAASSKPPASLAEVVPVAGGQSGSKPSAVYKTEAPPAPAKPEDTARRAFFAAVTQLVHDGKLGHDMLDPTDIGSMARKSLLCDLLQADVEPKELSTSQWRQARLALERMK